MVSDGSPAAHEVARAWNDSGSGQTAFVCWHSMSQAKAWLIKDGKEVVPRSTPFYLEAVDHEEIVAAQNDKEEGN